LRGIGEELIRYT